jgi:hypothetical protein
MSRTRCGRYGGVSTRHYRSSGYQLCSTTLHRSYTRRVRVVDFRSLFERLSQCWQLQLKLLLIVDYPDDARNLELCHCTVFASSEQKTRVLIGLLWSWFESQQCRSLRSLFAYYCPDSTTITLRLLKHRLSRIPIRTQLHIQASSLSLAETSTSQASASRSSSRCFWPQLKFTSR